MPTYATPVKTARMTATRDEVSGGTLEVRTSADAVLVTYDLTAVGGTVTTDTWTLAFANNTIAATGTGDANNIVIKNSGGAVMISGLTVGLAGSGANAIMDNLSVTTSQQVTITSATIQHAPDPA